MPQRRALLVGVGVCTPPAPPPGEGLDAVGLMVEAARAALADAGAPGLMRELGSVLVPKGTWTCADPGRLVGDRLGARGFRSVLVEAGIPQQTLVSDGLRWILVGDVEAVLVVGGEARRRAAIARRAGIEVGDEQAHTAPDEHRRPAGEIVSGLEIRAGLVEAVRQYALIESALGAADGLTVDAHLDEVAELWERCNLVARTNPHAAFPQAMDASALRSPGPGNRPLAHPYAKWHSTQWTVDQAAALLLCSEDAARRHGIDLDRCLVALVALESSHALSLPRRGALHRWPAMQILGRAAEAHLGLGLDEIPHVDLYSCFPAAVRVQQRELGLAPDGTPTVTGGMAFAGGPFNSYTFHSTAAVAERLRADPGALGLVTTVSGFLTKPGLAVWRAGASRGADLLVADLADDAAAATEEVPLLDGHDGSATVVASTVTYDDREEPVTTIVIADTDEGRTVATSDDRALAVRATTERLVGVRIDVRGASFSVA